MEILTGKTPRGWRAVVYGPAKIGKSTLATHCPAPLFIDIEDGLSQLNVHKTRPLTTYEEVIEGLRYFYSSNYETVVLDTVDFMEQLLWKSICKANGWRNIEAPGYGKGYKVALEKWLELFGIFSSITAANKNVLCLAHASIRSVNNPEGESYDRYQMNLHKDPVELFSAQMDAIYLAQYEVQTFENKEKNVLAKHGSRILHLAPRASSVTGNRWGLEGSLPLNGQIWRIMSAQPDAAAANIQF